MDIATIKSNLIYSLEQLKKSQYISEESADEINKYLEDLEKTEDEIEITKIQNKYEQLQSELIRLEKLYSYKLYFIKPGTLAYIDKVCRKLIGNPSSTMTLKSMIDQVSEKGIAFENALNSYITGGLGGTLTLDTLENVRDYAFYNFSSLSEFNAPNASSIGKSAFVGCTALTKINIPKATKCDSSFDSTMPFTDFTAGLSVSNWKSTSSADQPTFYQNQTIKMVSLPGVTNIDNQAFLGCKAIKSAYFTNSAGTNIKNSAFKDCKELITISAPDFTGTIYPSAFLNCEKLTSINFPKITVVSSSAFQNCKSLETVKLPLCATLNATAFNGAFTSNESAALEIDIGISTTQAIFSNKSNLKTVTMSRAQTIDTKAFMSCITLENTSFKAATKINDSAFQNCAKLSKFETPSVSTIGKNAFTSCEILNYIDIASCTAIGANAFSGCKTITWDFFIAPKLANIGANAFSDCEKIEYVDAPECSTIGSYPFTNCPISYINLGKLTTLASNVLRNTPIKILNLPQCTTITSQALTECVQLSQIFIPKCTKIQNKAFYNDIALTKITLENIATIESFAFQNCSSLSQIIITANAVPNLVNVNAFDGIENFKIYVPSSLYSSYCTAKNWSTFNDGRIAWLDSPILSIPFSVVDMADKNPCFQSYIQEDCEKFTDMSIGYYPSDATEKYNINGFHLRTPFYKGSSIVFYGNRKYCPIASDNCTITANKYVYNEETKSYSQAFENKYMYYTTDALNLENENKWVKVNSFDDIIVNNPTSSNNFITNKTFIIGRKSGEE